MTLRCCFFTVFLFFLAITGLTQHVENPAASSYRTVPAKLASSGQRSTSTEVCDNLIDEDLNGLVDYKDFTCYYTNANTENCMASKIAWAGTTTGLFWVDLETGTERFVGNMNGMVMNDITWSSDSKLYGIDGGANIWQIDPFTSAVTRISRLENYYAANGMTSDEAGNLYFAALRLSRWYIVKLNLATSQTTVVSDFSNSNVSGLESGGDLTFLNGSLYLSCMGGYLAKINPFTGGVTASRYSNLPPLVAYGMITLGDGLLYLSFNKSIYQLDPVTMQGNPVAYYTFPYSYLNVYGLANYTEHCNALPCKADISISTLSAQPFCSDAGVLVRANGSGFSGEGSYKWTLPDGSNTTNDSLLATTSGRYYVKYYTTPDGCSPVDSINLIITKPPQANFRQDTTLCEGSQLILTTWKTADISSYLWQDGSSLPGYTVNQAGTYWVDRSNLCGTAVDTFIVSAAFRPQVYLGGDTTICPGSYQTIKNYLGGQPGGMYNWSNGSYSNNITVASSGTYWAESGNACGITRDSIIISAKDSCSCFPFYPLVNLGANITICDDDSVLLKNLSHHDSFRYAWQDGSAGQILDTKTPGIYWLDVTTYCGTRRDSILISYKTQGCLRDVFVPTAFTPNMDDKNDFFKPIVHGQLKQYQLKVYNRWGQLVFNTNDYRKGWDGNFNGLAQETGVFVWSCSYQFKANKTIYKKGTVILLK